MAYNNYSVHRPSNNVGYRPYRKNSFYDRQGNSNYVSYDRYDGRSNQGGDRPKKKHSGCKEKLNFTAASGKRKDHVIHGWNYSRSRGMMSFVAVPCHDTTVNNKTGKDLAKWVISIFYKRDQRTETHTAFRNRGTGKLTVPKIGFVANPHAPNGGYFGKAYRD